MYLVTFLNEMLKVHHNILHTCEFNTNNIIPLQGSRSLHFCDCLYIF